MNWNLHKITRRGAMPHRHAAPGHRRARVAAALLSAALAGCQGSAGPAAHPQLQALQERCVAAMLNSSCRAVAGPDAAPRPGIIFVAGVGAVDAPAYAALREAGEAMCAIAHKQCSADWEAPACRTARSLWLTDSVAGTGRAGPMRNQTR